MPRKKHYILARPVQSGLKAIKVRLDARTVIKLANRDRLEFWKSRYPNAHIIA